MRGRPARTDGGDLWCHREQIRASPPTPGSVLWTHDSRVFLEGDQSRFPTEAISFAAHPTAPIGAAWVVEIDTTDFAAPALGSVRLLVNADHAVYRRLTDEPVSAQAARTKEYMRSMSRGNSWRQL